MPNEFLHFGGSRNCVNQLAFGNIGGFVGPDVFGAIYRTTASFHGGFLLASVSLFVSATLTLMLRKNGAVPAPLDSKALTVGGVMPPAVGMVIDPVAAK